MSKIRKARIKIYHLLAKFAEEKDKKPEEEKEEEKKDLTKPTPAKEPTDLTKPTDSSKKDEPLVLPPVVKQKIKSEKDLKQVETLAKKNNFSEQDLMEAIMALFGGSLGQLLKQIGVQIPEDFNQISQEMPWIKKMPGAAMYQSHIGGNTHSKYQGRAGQYAQTKESQEYQTDSSMKPGQALTNMFNYGRQWKGTPYGWGGAGKGQWSLDIPTESDKSIWRGRLQGRAPKTVDAGTGIDCSGFIQKVLAIGGVPIPYDTTAAGIKSYLLSNGGKPVGGPQPGAVVFFAGNSGISHVGIIDDRGNILESRGSAGVTDNLGPSSRGGMRKTYVMPTYPFLQKKPEQELLG